MDIYCKTISEIKALLDNGDLTSEEVIGEILDKVKSNPGNYSVLNHRALEMAKKVDEKKKEGKQLKSLAGIPVAVEDSISTKGILTQSASKILEEYIPVFDARVVEKLYEEEAILIGKTNLGEFGIGSQGNLYGTAKAVKDGEAALGLVLDTSGQAKLGGAKYGLFGIRPSYGLISRNGIIAHSSSIDQIGLISKSVEDMCIGLNVLVGKDEKDSTSVSNGQVDYTKTKNKSIKDFKIGIVKEYFEDSDEVEKKELKATIENLEKLGANIEYISMDSLNYGEAAYEIISSAEFSSNAARFDGISYGYRAKDYKDVEELYKKTRTEAFGLEVKEKILFGNFVINQDQYEDYYEKSQKLRSKLQEDFTNIFKEFDLILTNIDKKSVLGSNLAGIPSMAIPCKAHMENPIGFQIMGEKFKEADLLKFAYAYENEILKSSMGGGR